MRWVLALTLVASRVGLGAAPVEAISFDRPIRVLDEADSVRWASDGGTCLTPIGWGKIDTEFVRLQTIESRHVDEPSPARWFLGGLAAGGVVTLALGIGLYFATR